MSNFKKTLAGIIAAGALLALAGGTMAGFNASTVNPGNVLSNGTVTMTNVAGTVISGSNCTTATNNGTCATLFGTGNTSFKPGGPDAANSATITYTGSSTPTSDFRLYAGNYTAKLAASSALCTAPSSGAGNPGTALDLLVTVGSSSPSLLYPAASTTLSASGGLASGTSYTSLSVASAPALASGQEIILYSAGTYQQVTTSAAVIAGATTIPVTSFSANFSYPASTTQIALQGTLDNFASTYATSGTGLQLRGGTNGSGAAGAWATSDSSVFNIKVHLDGAAGNSFQGCQSQTDLDWYAAA
ncbi:MAG: hypothetical protein ACREPA_10865 [Candidatus Dormibacteraceae bacterium]